MKTRRCTACGARKPLKRLFASDEESGMCRDALSCERRIARNDVTFYRRLLGFAGLYTPLNLRTVLARAKTRATL